MPFVKKKKEYIMDVLFMVTVLFILNDRRLSTNGDVMLQ